MSTTFNNIYDIQSFIESGSVSILKNNAGITYVYNTRSPSEDRITPSVEVSFDLGSPTGANIISGSKVLYNAWTGTTRAMVISNRVTEPTSHSVFVSQVRDYLSDVSNYNTASVLPYHYVIKSSNDSTSNAVEDDLDMTILTFAQIVYVRPDAW